MRNQLIAGRVAFNYPDECAFINDRNTFTLMNISANNDGVGGAFTLTNNNGVSAGISYNSEQKNLTFNLLSILKKMLGSDTYNTVTVTGSVVCGEVSANITPFTLKCIDGRTLHSRGHNSERVIYYYDSSDLHGLELLSMNGGVINGFTVQPGITKMDFYQSGDFQIIQVDGDRTMTISVVKSSLGGDDGFCIDDDDDEGGTGGGSNGGVFRVRYVNTDGCHRFLVGKIISRKRSVGYTEWRADELVRHTPGGMVSATTDEITVGYPSVDRLSYAEDIMFSPVIEYVNQDGEWQPCILSTKSVNLTDWDSNDIELTYKTLA